MQQTTKYQFKLIEGSDDFSPQPLNDNVEKVEEVLEDMAETVEAVQSVTTVAYTPTNKPFVVGSYIGTNYDQTITLGFKPSFLIISGLQNPTAISVTDHSSHTVITAGHTASGAITLTDVGFTVHPVDTFPKLTNGFKFEFIAFR